MRLAPFSNNLPRKTSHIFFSSFPQTHIQFLQWIFGWSFAIHGASPHTMFSIPQVPGPFNQSSLQKKNIIVQTPNLHFNIEFFPTTPHRGGKTPQTGRLLAQQSISKIKLSKKKQSLPKNPICELDEKKHTHTV